MSVDAASGIARGLRIPDFALPTSDGRTLLLYELAAGRALLLAASGQELAAEEVVSSQVIQAGDLCILTVRVFDLKKATSSNAAAVEVFLSGAKGGSGPGLGFRWAPATTDRLREYGLPRHQTGFVVVSVDPDGLAAQAGLSKGILIVGGATKIDGKMAKLDPVELLPYFARPPQTLLLLQVFERYDKTRIYVQPRRAEKKAAPKTPKRRVFRGDGVK